MINNELEILLIESGIEISPSGFALTEWTDDGTNFDSINLERLTSNLLREFIKVGEKNGLTKDGIKELENRFLNQSN